MASGLTEAEKLELHRLLIKSRARVREEMEHLLLPAQRPWGPRVTQPPRNPAAALTRAPEARLTTVQRRAQDYLEIEAALRRMDDGSYGICVDTGEPIPIERLRACPTALRTAEAQAVHERALASGAPEQSRRYPAA